MEEIKIEEECCICYLETKNKTTCMHDVCIDCRKKINKCPIYRINLIENVDNNIEVGEIYLQVMSEYEELNIFEVSNFKNVRNIRTGEIIRPYFEDGG